LYGEQPLVPRSQVTENRQGSTAAMPAALAFSRQSGADTAMRDAIDCDIHVSVPGIKALLPYLSRAWRELVITRGIGDLDLACYPPNAPITCRPDWRQAQADAVTPLAALQQDVFAGFGARAAILNCLHGAQVVHSEDLAAALCAAINRWLVAEWLDQDPRLRASLVVPLQNPQYAAKEIEAYAHDKRFVQVLVLGMGEMLLGRRYYWPLYAAATQHGLPIGIHAGSAYRHAPTSGGWPTHITQDMVNQTAGFEGQLLSLMAEGVFIEFPELRIVLIESGVSWLPPFIWRAIKSWRALRTEAPWMRRSPGELLREFVRLTLQPFDAPGAAEVERTLAHIDSDDLVLFSTDYPHWQFDGPDPMPPGVPVELMRKICVDNPLATYPRLRETLQ
jgi:predicted TIM-barrel fold metal-dependent hydrolase